MGRPSGMTDLAHPVDAKIAPGSVAELEDWVREHRVTWETSSRREVASGPDAPAPLLVTLIGRYPGGRFPAGDDGFTLVFERLRQVALHALASVPEARFRIDPFDAAVRLRPEGDWLPEVELTLVLETDGDPADEDARRELLGRIEPGLERLGVRRKQWGEP